MKASEAVNKLVALIAEHGDIDIKITPTPYQHLEILGIQHGYESELVSAGETSSYSVIAIIPETETLE